tara:strand:- start:1182 stop:1790 length:609 start_codon:yes stop_codon:yes gene_type:complete
MSQQSEIMSQQSEMMSQQNDVESESKKLEKKIKKEFEKLTVLQSIQDISQQFNKCQIDVLKYVFKTYIEGKKEITFQKFKDSIIAKRRPQLKQDKHPDDAKLYNGTATNEEIAKYKNRCRFIILHKNKLVQCRHLIHSVENNYTFSDVESNQHSDNVSDSDLEEESTSNELNNNYINNTCLCTRHKGQNNVLASEFIYPIFD